MKTLSATVVGVFALISLASGTNYFIEPSPAGSDANDCLTGNPCLTFQAVFDKELAGGTHVLAVSAGVYSMPSAIVSNGDWTIDFTGVDMTMNSDAFLSVNDTASVVINGGDGDFSSSSVRGESGGCFLLSNSGSLSINSLTVSQCGTLDLGGAVFVDGASASFIGNSVTFSNNTANGPGFDGYGGAIATVDGSVTCTDCVFEGNTATVGGGAISATGATATVTLTNGDMLDNSVSFVGGGIYTFASSLDIQGTWNCSGNVGANNGGCIYCVDCTFLNADDTVIVTSNFGGGGGSNNIVCAGSAQDCPSCGGCSAPLGVCAMPFATGVYSNSEGCMCQVGDGGPSDCSCGVGAECSEPLTNGGACIGDDCYCPDGKVTGIFGYNDVCAELVDIPNGRCLGSDCFCFSGYLWSDDEGECVLAGILSYDQEDAKMCDDLQGACYCSEGFTLNEDGDCILFVVDGTQDPAEGAVGYGVALGVGIIAGGFFVLLAVLQGGVLMSWNKRRVRQMAYEKMIADKEEAEAGGAAE